MEKVQDHLIIRDYNRKDYKSLKALWKQTDIDGDERGDDFEMIKSTLDHDGRLILLELLPGKQIIGSVWITNDHRRLYLHHMAIATSHQGKGYSKYLMKESMEIARLLGLQIKLEAGRYNEVAKNIYLKSGFKYLGDYDVYIVRKP